MGTTTVGGRTRSASSDRRSTHLAAVPDESGPDLREFRLLGHGAAAARRTRWVLQPSGGGRGRRAQIGGARTWPLYPMKAGQIYVNFGFWGTVPLPPGAQDGYYNRRVEDEVGELGGHKGLYSTSFYSRSEE